jgi:hypothetical protein
MTDYTIRCASGCGEELGYVSLEGKVKYPGDQHYGMLCDKCSKKKQEEKQTTAHQLIQIFDKLKNNKTLTNEEITTVLKSLRIQE